MKVLYINNTDLPGRSFNGYDLGLEMRKRKIDAYQLVMDKYSNEEMVIKLDYDDIKREKLIYLEEKHCVKNVLFPYANMLVNMGAYKNADIIHFHFPYHNMISLLDYERVMDKRTVWTIHDMWPVTGNCTNPLNCNKWMTGCGRCDRFDDDYFPMKLDNTAFMWGVKREAYKNINPHIVVSSKYMKKYILNSPLTMHFSNISVIPFGIDVTDFKKEDHSNVVIGFRADQADIKGCKYLYEALSKLRGYENRIQLQCVGQGAVPDIIKAKYNIIEYGWINDRDKLTSIMKGWDIFIMPSIGESFGMMALESLGCKCALICFENTPMEEITKAPQFAMAARYLDTNDLRDKIIELVNDEKKRKKYQEEGFVFVNKAYPKKEYVESHIRLYKQIMEENKSV